MIKQQSSDGWDGEGHEGKMKKPVVSILAAALIIGAVAGGGAGLLGGYIYDQNQKSQANP